MNSRFSPSFRLLTFFVLTSFCGSNVAYASENGVPNPVKKKDDKIAQGFEPKQMKERVGRHQGMIQKKGDNESLKRHLHEKSDKRDDHDKSDDRARETRIRESQENESEDHDDFESKEHSIKNDLKDKRIESKGLSKPDDKDEDEHDSKDRAESSFKDHHSRRGHQDRDHRDEAPDSEDLVEVSRDDSAHEPTPQVTEEPSQSTEQLERFVTDDSASKELEREVETAKIETPQAPELKDVKIEETKADLAPPAIEDVKEIVVAEPVVEEVIAKDPVEVKAEDTSVGEEPVPADGAKEVFMIEPVLIAEPLPPSGPASGFVPPGDTIGPGPVIQDIKSGLEPVATDGVKETFIPEPVVGADPGKISIPEPIVESAALPSEMPALETQPKLQEPVGQPIIAPEPVVGGDPGMISIPGPFLESDPLSGQPAPDDGNLKPLPVLIEDPLLAKKPILVKVPGLPVAPPIRKIIIPGPITGPDPVILNQDQ